MQVYFFLKEENIFILPTYNILHSAKKEYFRNIVGLF